MHAGQTPHESCRYSFFFSDAAVVLSSAKSDGAGATVVLPFCLSHTINCVKARAIFNALLPSLPKNNITCAKKKLRGERGGFCCERDRDGVAKKGGGAPGCPKKDPSGFLKKTFKISIKCRCSNRSTPRKEVLKWMSHR
mgnify:CR=1 FL=1